MKSNVVSMMSAGPDCRVATATVRSAVRDGALVETGSGIVSAAVAFGCLIKPVAGDKVLVSLSPRENYVLSVLERPTGTSAALDFPGDAAINVPNGKLELNSSSEMRLSSAVKTNVLSPEASVTAGRVEVSTGKTTACLGDLETHVNDAKIFAGSLHTVAKRVTQRFDALMRWVETVETLNIGNLIQNVRGALASHSHHAVITARKDVKIDGERIHMG